jgi:hypothetical protein
LRQNNADQCEIVGCHVNAISQVFMPNHFMSSDGGCHHHIENLYKDRLLTKFLEERILVCDVFQIEPTHVGGWRDIITEL